VSAPAKAKEQRMDSSLLHLLRDEQGATAVEYGLIVAAIAGLVIAVVFVLGNKINNVFNNVQSAMP
jgi:pilus assembly protein Flp/PilA